MRKITGLIIVAAAFLVTSCTYQKNNRIDQKDVNAKNSRVYGHPDSLARQRSVQYEPNSENEVRAMEIEEKLFGTDGNNGNNIVAN